MNRKLLITFLVAVAMAVILSSVSLAQASSGERRRDPERKCYIIKARWLPKQGIEVCSKRQAQRFFVPTPAPYYIYRLRTPTPTAPQPVVCADPYPGPECASSPYPQPYP